MHSNIEMQVGAFREILYGSHWVVVTVYEPTHTIIGANTYTDLTAAVMTAFECTRDCVIGEVHPKAPLTEAEEKQEWGC